MQINVNIQNSTFTFALEMIKYSIFPFLFFLGHHCVVINQGRFYDLKISKLIFKWLFFYFDTELCFIILDLLQGFGFLILFLKLFWSKVSKVSFWVTNKIHYNYDFL